MPKAKKKKSRYGERAAALKRLGFKDYPTYLASKLWQRIRGQVLNRDRGRCLICRCNDATEVHHISYNYHVLSGRDVHRLISVCRACHEGSEFDEGGQKRLTTGEINSAIHELSRLAGGSFPSPRKAKRLKGPAKTPKRNKPLPVCRCCGKPSKSKLGRASICLVCHKTGFAARITNPDYFFAKHAKPAPATQAVG